ncbi:MAG: hypothetical protein J1E56_07700, partial [Ruminococcus sp.]|nr:hypothetical protein [Ruminococcus sp.]
RAKKYTEKALKPRCFKAFSVAGAEGLEPSARGFGADVEMHKPLICLALLSLLLPFYRKTACHLMLF